MSKVTISLDQSSRCSGFAVFKDQTLYAFNKFTFTDADMGTRLMKIRNKVKDLIKEYNPNEVVFEDIQHQNNVANNIQTFKALAQVYGVISELLAEERIPAYTTLASSWKSTLGIKGKSREEQKRNAQKYVEDTYRVRVESDVADAICIGAAHLRQEACAF